MLSLSQVCQEIIDFRVISAVGDAQLLQLHTLEISQDNGCLLAPHWQQLARLQQLRRFGFCWGFARMSLTTPVHHMRDAGFGATLEVLELCGTLENPAAAAATAGDMQASSVLPPLRLFSLVTFLRWVSSAVVSSFVLCCPRLQLCLSEQTPPVRAASTLASMPLPLSRDVLDAIPAPAPAQFPSRASLSIQLIVGPRFEQYLFPHEPPSPAAVVAADELRQQIPHNLHSRVQVALDRPTEIYWSTW
jgi:hypothetical protein